MRSLRLVRDAGRAANRQDHPLRCPRTIPEPIPRLDTADLIGHRVRRPGVHVRRAIAKLDQRTGLLRLLSDDVCRGYLPQVLDSHWISLAKRWILSGFPFVCAGFAPFAALVLCA